MIKKPMLSATVHAHNLEKIEWPALVSNKLDGIRCLMHPELGPVTRSFKPVPNVHMYTILNDLVGGFALDGELLAIDEHGEVLSFNETQSAVMSRSGQPRFIYAVFDCFLSPEISFADRFATAIGIVEVLSLRYPESRHLSIVKHEIVKDEEEFLGFAEESVADGFEGTMIRRPDGPYKSGRSTLPQGWLVKYKEWLDAEGTVVGFEERMHNSNEDIKDNFGYAKRSSSKEGMVPMGTLGALILDTEWGELRVGSGFDDSTRQSIWERNCVPARDTPNGGVEFIVRGKQPDIGRRVTFKYQPFGMQDKPRFPIFLHFREDE